MRLRVLLVLAAAALVVSGCGDADARRANAYVDAVNAAQSRFAATIDRLATRITPTSTPASDRATIASFTKAVDSVVAELRATRPPERVAGLHAQLVGEIATYRDDVRRAGAALASQDAQQLVTAQERLQEATRRVSRAIDATIGRINRRLR